MRASTLDSGPGIETVRQKELQGMRNQLFHRFGNQMAAAQSVRHSHDNSHTPQRVTRSSTVPEDDNWVVDMDATDYEVTDVQQLDCYPLEHIFTLLEKSRLLLLVLAQDDDALFNGLGEKIDSLQGNERVTLSSHTYYKLKCSVNDALFNPMVTDGVTSKMYSQENLWTT
jgi:hypothetical protein